MNWEWETVRWLDHDGEWHDGDPHDGVNRDDVYGTTIHIFDPETGDEFWRNVYFMGPDMFDNWDAMDDWLNDWVLWWDSSDYEESFG